MRTVVAALRMMREQGWIDSQQGKGRFVRGRPAMDSVESNRPGQAYLTTPEADTPGEVLELPNRTRRHKARACGPHAAR